MKDVPAYRVEEVNTVRPVDGGDGRARLPDGRVVRTPPDVRVVRVPVAEGDLTALIPEEEDE